MDGIFQSDGTIWLWMKDWKKWKKKLASLDWCWTSPLGSEKKIKWKIKRESQIGPLEPSYFKPAPNKSSLLTLSNLTSSKSLKKKLTMAEWRSMFPFATPPSPQNFIFLFFIFSIFFFFYYFATSVAHRPMMMRKNTMKKEGSSSLCPKLPHHLL